MNAASWWNWGLAVLLAAVPGAVLAQAPADAPRPVALVNGEPVWITDLDAVLKQDYPEAAKFPEAQRKQLQLAVVGGLVDDRLLQQFLRTNGPRVQEADVNAWMNQMAGSLKAQGHTLQQYCQERGLTDAQLRQNVTEMLQWNGYVAGRLTEAELKRYYAENRDFFDRVIVRASHIVIRTPGFMPEPEKQAARARLQGLRAEIVAGRLDFAAAAQKHSQCTSAPNGGDIGRFPRKGVVHETIARAAFALQVGQVSDVIQSDYGLHLIKLTERSPGQPTTYEKVKEDVRVLAAEELRQAVLAEQRKVGRVEIFLGSEPVTRTGGR